MRRGNSDASELKSSPHTHKKNTPTPAGTVRSGSGSHRCFSSQAAERRAAAPLHGPTAREGGKGRGGGFCEKCRNVGRGEEYENPNVAAPRPQYSGTEGDRPNRQEKRGPALRSFSSVRAIRHRTRTHKMKFNQSKRNTIRPTFGCCGAN